MSNEARAHQEDLQTIRLSTQLLRLLDRLWQNQYWDSDGQQTSGARTSAVVSRDFINLSLDEEVDRIDHTNDHGGDEENDGETDDETNDRGDFEGEYDSDDDCDGSAYAGSGHCEVDSNVAAGTQSDDLFYAAVLFSSVLRYSKTRQSFLQARDFTTHLCALICNQRLVLLERALPVRAYPGLGIEARPRSNQLQRLNKMRKRFLVTGLASSFDEFFNLRNYGRVAAQSDTPPFLLHWNDDGQSVWWKDSSPLSMSQFRQLSGQLIQEAESLCYELMYGLEPAIDLESIKDDMTNRQQGYSFVSDTANNLHQAYLALSRQACTAVHGSLSHKGRWKWKAVDKYLRTESRFRVIVGLRIRPKGTIQVTHHLHHPSSQGKTIYEPRVPSRPSRVLYKYLAYIRPFVELLQREQAVWLAVFVERQAEWSDDLGATAVETSQKWYTYAVDNCPRRLTDLYGNELNYDAAVHNEIYNQTGLTPVSRRDLRRSAFESPVVIMTNIHTKHLSFPS
ncbi:telomere-associated RecQ helicase [Metarhizium robertsii ARSEF 23]|uniref:Telomere-associated RecQ helicase n=1 Tax=Metarhizium robertsii (strain ARSEF 23 / ATCC MYA-3075) TaxID=655844 RepID=E9FE40_METRA|nr:telomere-associated RecQ helicase [Metarhizium robertsii ARSEF 23]EFY93997.2 telomere-associated RecQ helicase [Metarhizium robertsii ARSEF 23]